MFKKHVLLLVEDDEDIIKLIKVYLKSTKVKIYVSKTGEDAIEIVRSKPIDIAFVDYKLPYKNGIIITNEIRAIKDIPIVLETGEKMLCENPELSKEFLFDDVLCKPFNRDTVMEILEKYLK